MGICHGCDGKGWVDSQYKGPSICPICLGVGDDYGAPIYNVSYEAGYEGLLRDVFHDFDSEILGYAKPWGKPQGATLEESLEEAIGTLAHTKRGESEALALRLCYGLDDGLPQTLQSIGDIMGLSALQVHKYVQMALRKLRHPSRSKLLRSYLAA